MRLAPILLVVLGGCFGHGLRLPDPAANVSLYHDERLWSSLREFVVFQRDAEWGSACRLLTNCVESPSESKSACVARLQQGRARGLIAFEPQQVEEVQPGVVVIRGCGRYNRTLGFDGYYSTRVWACKDNMRWKFSDFIVEFACIDCAALPCSTSQAHRPNHRLHRAAGAAGEAQRRWAVRLEGTTFLWTIC